VLGAYDCVGFCQIVSGLVLVTGVVKIRNFFKKQGAENFINTPMLMRHAASFGLYLVTTVVFFISFSLMALSPYDLFFWNLLNLVAIFYYVGQLISEILLVQIFYDLGKKTDKDAKQQAA